MTDKILKKFFGGYITFKIQRLAGLSRTNFDKIYKKARKVQ